MHRTMPNTATLMMGKPAVWSLHKKVQPLVTKLELAWTALPVRPQVWPFRVVVRLNGGYGHWDGSWQGHWGGG